jgi:hypothetical protein
MIDNAYGVQNKTDYYPSTRWHINNLEYKNSYLRPDAVMIRNGTIYVLDAKYYKYGNTKQTGDLPDSSDINKQITYGEFIAENKAFRGANGKSPEVYNAFVMPYDSFGEMFHTEEELHFIGSAISDWKSSDGTSTYEKVAGILLDVKSLMQDYTHNDSRINDLADLIESKIGL